MEGYTDYFDGWINDKDDNYTTLRNMFIAADTEFGQRMETAQICTRCEEKVRKMASCPLYEDRHAEEIIIGRWQFVRKASPLVSYHG